jgi:uncharacterized damage-inducible protein DinB
MNMQITKVPHAQVALCQAAVDTYASETNKTASIFAAFAEADPAWRPHAKSMTVLDVMKHQLLSERRFFAEFLGLPEPPAATVIPAEPTALSCAARLAELATPRLDFLAAQDEAWWLGRVPFFDVERQRTWVFWRRVLHSAHHRTQLTVYLRLLDLPVLSVYGPTADVTWAGADPTLTVR